ncbi:MAG: hypothetical protein H0U00_11445 [Actinobacteria bacterium]|nr:hypothetical protein [Actinomycetota bacterium]
MALRSLGACVLVAVFITAGATASGSDSVVPRFSLSATTATTDDEVTLRVVRTPRISQGEIRQYLVPANVAASVRSRFDPRLSFIGTVRASRQARSVFTVPPLEAGRYALAYWCRGCLPRGKGIGIQASPRLRVTVPAGEGCPTTKPNGNVPPLAPGSWTGFQWHGNGALWTWLRPDGILVTNALGGEKKIWIAKESGLFRVRYWMLDPPSSPVTAQVISGTLSGYDGPSWASRMSFQPGCWQITGRLGDVSLSFVVQVMLGNA